MKDTHPLPTPPALPEIAETLIYPAVHHFRIIVLADSPACAEIEALLAGYDVSAPLCHGRKSRGERYQSLQVSVRLADRAEHRRLDGALRAATGVRMLL